MSLWLVQAFVFASALSLSACGDAEPAGADEQAREVTRKESARFLERTSFEGADAPPTEEIRGLFDWSTRTGRAVSMLGGARSELVQLGDDCYRRQGTGAWRRSTSDDVDGACDAAIFANPATTDDLLRAVASDVRTVGREPIRGVQTTHLRGELNIGAVKGLIEFWVDSDGVVRKTIQRGENGGEYVTTREYFEFGVAATVERPVVGKGKG